MKKKNGKKNNQHISSHNTNQKTQPSHKYKKYKNLKYKPRPRQWWHMKKRKDIGV